MAVIVKRALDYMNMEDKSSKLTFADTSSINAKTIIPQSVTLSIMIFLMVALEKMGSISNLEPMQHVATQRKSFLDFLPQSKKKMLHHRIENEKPELTFDTATIQADGTTKLLKKYKTYDEALAVLKGEQAILYGDSIIKMPSGIVVTKPTLASSLTNIY